MERILVVCTANQCRSPLAAALLSRQVSAGGADATILSAGLLESGNPAAAEVVVLGPTFGVDLRHHRSLAISDSLLVEADLVVCMTRRHVRELAVVDQTAWPRIFTLRELVREGRRRGPRPGWMSLADWIAPLHEARTPSDLLGADPSDDVADPMGGPSEGFEEMARDLDALTADLAALLWSKPDASDRHGGTDAI